MIKEDRNVGLLKRLNMCSVRAVVVHAALLQ